jgi:tetratricopeptide (TPR) repeat protein
MAEEKQPTPGNEGETPAVSPEHAPSTQWTLLWKKLTQGRLPTYLTLGVAVIVVGWLAYRQYLASQNEECLREMRFAESYFRQDSFEKALKGTATALGFEQLVEEYGSTDAGNLCRLYLGICYLKLNNPQAAIETLSDYDAPDSYLGGAAYAALAGAYAEVKEFTKAAHYYEKAAKLHNNNQTSPVYLIQAGLCYELAQEFSQAARLYERVVKEYPLAGEAPTAQKHLSRVQAHAP